MRRLPNPPTVPADILDAALALVSPALRRRVTRRGASVDHAYLRGIAQVVSAHARERAAARGFGVHRREESPEAVTEEQAAQDEAALDQKAEEIAEHLTPILEQVMERQRPVFEGDLLMLSPYGTLKEVVSIVTPYNTKLDTAQLTTREITEDGYKPPVTEWFYSLKDKTARIGYRLVLYRGKNPELIAKRRETLRREREKKEQLHAAELERSLREPWFIDLAEEVIAEQYPSKAIYSRTLAKYLRNHGVSASITIPRGSMMFGLDFENARKSDKHRPLPWTEAEAQRIAELLIGQVEIYESGRYRVRSRLDPKNRDVVYDQNADYNDFPGVRIPRAHAREVQTLLAHYASKAGDALTPYGQKLLEASE